MNLESILNNLLTSGIGFSDPETVRKLKTLTIFQLSFIMLSPILGLFYFHIRAIPLFYTCILAGLMMFVGVILLRKTKNILLVGHYTISIVWLFLFIISWNTGAITHDGVIKTSWILNAGLILFAIFLNGYPAGTTWSIIIFIQTGCIVYLYRQGYLFNNMIPPEMAITYSMGTFLICLLAILMFAFLFEKEKREAMTRELEKSQILRESRKYMNDIFDRYPLPTFILDKSHRVIQWNRACQELTGISLDQISGKYVWDGFNVDGQGSIADQIIDNINVISQKYSDSIISVSDAGWFEISMVFPKLNKTGQTIVTAAPILNNSGAMIGAIQTIQKAINTDGQGAVQNCFINNCPYPVFKIDSQYKINFWNKACADKLGYSSTDMVGANPLSFITENYHNSFKKAITRVLNGESCSNMEWSYRTQSGKPAYVIARAFPCETQNGADNECIIVNTDITALVFKFEKLSLKTAESKQNFKNLSQEYDLLKKNIATIIRKKEGAAD